MTHRHRSLEGIGSAEEWGRCVLGPSERRIATAAIEAMLCDRGAEWIPPSSEWVAHVVGRYDLSLGACSIQMRLAMRVLLRLLEWLPVLVVRRVGPMSRLPIGERVRYLESLEAHRFAPLTMLLVATKVPMLVSAFEQGDALRMTGYDRPTTFARRRLPLSLTTSTEGDANLEGADG